MILVEGPPLLIHERIAGPGLGDQKHHRMGEAIAALHQKFERVVEAGRVRLAFIGNRPEFRNVVAKKR
jgi:methyl coenzyme M reductase subunit D